MRGRAHEGRHDRVPQHPPGHTGAQRRMAHSQTTPLRRCTHVLMSARAAG